MSAMSLGDDKAEPLPPQPWQAEDFLAHLDRARELVDPWIPFASYATDLDSARALLQRYADKQAADTGRLYGIWPADTLLGGARMRRAPAELPPPGGAARFGDPVRPRPGTAGPHRALSPGAAMSRAPRGARR